MRVKSNILNLYYTGGAANPTATPAVLVVDGTTNSSTVTSVGDDPEDTGDGGFVTFNNDAANAERMQRRQQQVC